MRTKICLGVQFILLNVIFQASTAEENDVSQLLIDKGYKAENHYVTVKDGYILNLVRCLNPLINNGEGGLPDREPILFLHGSGGNGNVYVANSIGAKPIDYSNYSLAELSIEELRELLKDDPAANSIALTAVNFGHEVWLLNRRGTLPSLGHTDAENTQPYPSLIQNFLATYFNIRLPSIFGQSNRQGSEDNVSNRQIMGNGGYNPRYWNFSLDEQAKYDLPESVDYVLQTINRSKLSFVGHSAGGAIFLMSLLEKPELGEKISKAVLWAPAMYFPFKRSIANSLGINNIPGLTGYVGPQPTSVSSMRELVGTICGTELTRRLICAPYVSLVYGEADDQQLLLPEILKKFIDAVSSHSYDQLIQAAATEGKMHHFDYQSSRSNQIAYGQSTPPLYNVSQITFPNISLWAGNTDREVPKEGVENLAADFRVPVDMRVVNGSDVYFNHLSFYIHKNLSSLAVIPTLKIIG